MKDLFIVSDFHLGEGMGSPSEDFYYDHEFCGFLDYVEDHPSKPALLMNGDFVDFLQVISKEGLKYFDHTREEKKYGLGTSPAKTCWKLDRIVKGHKFLFERLGMFCAKRDFYLIYGNHDIEFYWPQVQKRLMYWLVKFGGPSVKKHVKFFPWIYFDGTTYVEHGQQYHAINSFRYLLYPELPKKLDGQEKEIDLPFGSFFTRYFFNIIEKTDPQADNIKPATRYMYWAAKKRPKMVFRAAFRYWPFLVKTWNKSREIRRYTEKKGKRYRLQHERMKAMAKNVGLSYTKLKQIDEMKEDPIMESDRFLKYVMKVHMRHKFEAIFREKAEQLGKLVGAKHVVMGHTHKAEFRDFGKVKYFNTGTWMPISYEKNVDYSKDKKLTYLQILKGRAKLLEWV